MSNSVTLESFNGSPQLLKADANNTLDWRGNLIFFGQHLCNSVAG